MDTTKQYADYLITVALNSRNLYIKIIDIKLFVCYESEITFDDITFRFGQTDKSNRHVFDIMEKCVNKEPGCCISINITNKTIKLVFFRVVVLNEDISGFTISIIQNTTYPIITMRSEIHKYEMNELNNLIRIINNNLVIGIDKPSRGCLPDPIIKIKID